MGLTRAGHLQKFVWSLASGVSSSGGGLPGRPDLARGQGVRYFGRKRETNAYCPNSRGTLNSVGRNREVDGDFGLGLDGVAALKVRLEMPLTDGVFGRGSQDMRAADHA